MFCFVLKFISHASVGIVIDCESNVFSVFCLFFREKSLEDPNVISSPSWTSKKELGDSLVDMYRGKFPHFLTVTHHVCNAVVCPCRGAVLLQTG